MGIGVYKRSPGRDGTCSVWEESGDSEMRKNETVRQRKNFWRTESGPYRGQHSLGLSEFWAVQRRPRVTPKFLPWMSGKKVTDVRGWKG